MLSRPSMTNDLKAVARQYLWTAGMPWALISQMGPVVFERGTGSCLYSIDGKRYYDGMSGAWVVNVGHGRSEIAATMYKQASKLAFVLVEGYADVPAIQLAERLARFPH